MCELRDVFIVGAARTPIGSYLGTLKNFSAPELGGIAIKEAVKRAGIKGEEVDEVIMGNVVSAGIGQAPAKQAAVKGGLPYTISCFAVNKVCGSALKAVALAAQAIWLEEKEIVVAGGMESMSRAPHLLWGLREGLKFGDATMKDAMIYDGLWCAFHNIHMGNTGEIIAEKFGATREEQDAYAVSSHQRALQAIDKGYFEEEIVPVTVPQRKGEPLIFKVDEGPRRDATLEKLARLKPVFKKDGTVTAGNASTLNDGAAAVVVASADAVKAKGLKPLARILGSTTNGVEPSMVMYAPKGAIEKLLANVGWKLEDVDLFEINEAFSSQMVVLLREMGLDREKVNVHGGAVALGHPIGATGARILVTLLYALKHRGLKKGVAALCLGGGDAVAMAVEMV
ncbi:MAG: acetyl-CoA C-acyltransferase [Candidatus Aminicenantes bacterium]|nr:MAG: acetyl-CoA acetyltransferase [Candidatus Aminicenantes bacterium 4484_214]RLE00486.1 MAG: acetyl-CoA C-acyltransferase [Candidatus Aminicenantes bacterium]RLE06065.1 MAG: acetyl-CoA C-acyltransferase [Candidatus Aminicenantes bacterium]HHF42324.1 acetyl-CoA C-acetyltransferase [Candidatus Aminicenantes bacterium]